MNFKVSFNTKWADFDPNRHMRHTAYNDYAAEVRVRYFASQNFTLNDFVTLIGILGGHYYLQSMKI